jgi:sugar phosphate isomerase/epimerase
LSGAKPDTILVGVLKDMSNASSPSLLSNGRPRAITMWDFSWLERRWPGAGYENWAAALDGLVERGYDAIRLDAYPHFLGTDPEAPRDLVPVWNINDWGSPAPITVRPWPALAEFLILCRERGIQVGLSTWFRQDRSNSRLAIADPRAHADLWIRTLDLIEREGLADTVLYVDLCNEFPGEFWAPFFRQDTGVSSWNADTDRAFAWMTSALAAFRAAKPRYPATVSFNGTAFGRIAEGAAFDFFDPHVWLVHLDDFYARIGHKNDVFDLKTWDPIVANAERMYRSHPEHWLGLLRRRIGEWADFSRATGRPLITTECWGIVDYRDWPGLDWGWVKESCEAGVEAACATGRWHAVATSNFCGPQFAGMWQDVAWHRRLTDRIRASVPS